MQARQNSKSLIVTCLLLFGCWIAVQHFVRGCNRPTPTVERVIPEPAPPLLLWNGTLGVRLTELGLTDLDDPTKTPAFFSSHYDEQSEALQPIDNPATLLIKINGQDIRRNVRNLKSSLSFADGVLTTEWDTGSCSIHLSTSIYPSTPILFQTMTIRSIGQCDVEGPEITDDPPPDSRGFVRTSQGFYRRIRQRIYVGKISVPQSSDSEGKPIHLSAGSRIVILREVSLANDKEPLPVSKLLSDDPPVPTWTNVMASGGQIEIDGPAEDQKAVQSMVYYLRTGLHNTNGGPISPMMMSSDIYNGHQFWDADVWLFPALALLDPEAASAIPRYRLSHQEAATKRVGDEEIIQFPWESSISGRETAPPSHQNQIHVSGDVAWSLALAADLGLVNEKEATKVGRGVANYFLSRATKRADGKLELKKVMSPDENHIGDNDLYTNMIADWVIRKYRPDKHVEFYFPHDATSFLNYDEDGLRTYKQTAGLLAIYPLQDSRAIAEAERMFDRFSDKIIGNGPAMSDSIHAIIAARLNRSAESYQLWRKSWVDFMKGPAMLFSEKRKTARTYFTTGAAGCLQSVLYGFCGLEFSETDPGQVPWKTQLSSTRWLACQPHLPPGWKKVVLHRLSIHGQKLDFTISKNSCVVTPAAPTP